MAIGEFQVAARQQWSVGRASLAGSCELSLAACDSRALHTKTPTNQIEWLPAPLSKGAYWTDLAPTSLVGAKFFQATAPVTNDVRFGSKTDIGERIRHVR